MSRSTAHWLVAPAPPATPRVVTPLPRSLPPPGVRRQRDGTASPSPRPTPDETAWPVALLHGTCVGLLVVVLGLLLWSVLPTLLGWRAQVVLTGSMQPRIHPGDLVLAAPVTRGELKPGRVLLFRDPVHPGRTIVHRLVRYDDNGEIVTKGDANRSEDSTPIAPSAVLGLPRLRVPYIGRPVVWQHDGDRQALLLGLLVLGGGATASLWPVFVAPPRTGSRASGGHRR